MSRFLFASWPFEGHVYPQLSVARELRDRGEEVAFYTAETMRAPIEREGLTLHPFERVDSASWLRVEELERRAGGRYQSLRAGWEAFRQWLVETVPGQVADLERIIADWKPDVIIADYSMWGPNLVLRDSTSVPVVAFSLLGTVIPGPDAPPSGLGLARPRTRVARAGAAVLRGVNDVLARGVRRRVNEFRAERGLPPLVKSVSAAVGDAPLYLVGGLRELDYDRHDLPETVHYVGSCVWHPATEARTASILDAIPDDLPWVHVTEGTSHHQDPFVLRAAVKGLAGRPVHAILTTGRKRDPEQLGFSPLPANIHLAQWVSHTELLPRCAVVVTTGGANTILSSLQAGVPLVIVPTTWDKPDNARRVTEAGVGVRLSPGKCSPEGLRDAIEHVLGDPTFRRNAQRIAAQFAAAPGPKVAADLLQPLAGAGFARRPVQV